MAGDWIKMRGNLWDDPRISKICDLTGTSEAAIVGGLYWLWATADQHSEDGIMPGLTLRSIDRKTGIDGFGDALVAIGWIADHPEGVRIIRFEEHNGASAKRRCSESKRKMSARDADNEQTESGSGAEESQQSCAPREEKRREEKSIKTKSRAESNATRLPHDWMPSLEDAKFCQTERPDLSIDRTAAKFRDYWVSAPKGVKKDWSATWRNWVRSEDAQQRAPPQGYESTRDKSRRETIEKLTGRTKNDQCNDNIIDIN